MWRIHKQPEIKEQIVLLRFTFALSPALVDRRRSLRLRSVLDVMLRDVFLLDLFMSVEAILFAWTTRQVLSIHSFSSSARFTHFLSPFLTIF